MGSHLVMDFSHLSYDLLNDLDGLFAIMNSINEDCKISVLGHLKHKFEPHGCSIVFLLATSHHSCHSWPENGKIHIDFYHCGDAEKVHQTIEKVANLYSQKLGGVCKMTVVERR